MRSVVVVRTTLAVTGVKATIGCSIPTVIPHLHYVPVNTLRENRNVFVGRCTQHLACSNIETGAMTRTLDFTTVRLFAFFAHRRPKM